MRVEHRKGQLNKNRKVSTRVGDHTLSNSRTDAAENSFACEDGLPLCILSQYYDIQSCSWMAWDLT